jgi:hypothetical protein
MILFRPILIGTIFSLVAYHARAAETAEIMGYGALTCAQFGQDYQKSVDVESQFYNWAQGFMSGLNTGTTVAEKGTVDLHATSIVNQKQKLREYCDEHPLSAYSLAVTVLWASLPIVPYSAPKP